MTINLFTFCLKCDHIWITLHNNPPKVDLFELECPKCKYRATAVIAQYLTHEQYEKLKSLDRRKLEVIDYYQK